MHPWPAESTLPKSASTGAGKIALVSVSSWPTARPNAKSVRAPMLQFPDHKAETRFVEIDYAPPQDVMQEADPVLRGVASKERHGLCSTSHSVGSQRVETFTGTLDEEAGAKTSADYVCAWKEFL